MLSGPRKKALGAAALWYAVALMLCVWGVIFISRAEAAHEPGVAWVVLLGVGIGLLKGRFVLQRGARHTLARIRGLPEGASFFKIYHPAYALLVPFMMGLGIGLRHLATNGQLAYRVIAAIYFGVSAALMLGARPYWQHPPTPSASKS